MTEEQKPVQHVELPAPPIRFTANAFHILLLAGAVALTWWLTRQDNEKYRQALSETANAQFQQISHDVAKLRGNVVSQGDLEKKVRDTMDPALNRFVSQQNGQFTNLAVAIGELRGAVTTLKPPTGGTRADDGSFKDVTLSQNRDGAPPLTTVKLSYDPKQPGFTGLSGQWSNNSEKFTTTLAGWRTEHDGMRSAVHLKREVIGPDGKKIGEEDIPQTSGDAFFSNDAIARTAPVPPYTLHIGSSYDKYTGRKRLAGLIGTQLTPNDAVTTGYVNEAWTVLYSHRFKLPW